MRASNLGEKAKLLPASAASADAPANRLAVINNTAQIVIVNILQTKINDIKKKQGKQDTENRVLRGFALLTCCLSCFCCPPELIRIDNPLNDLTTLHGIFAPIEGLSQSYTRQSITDILTSEAYKDNDSVSRVNKQFQEHFQKVAK